MILAMYFYCVVKISVRECRGVFKHVCIHFFYTMKKKSLNKFIIYYNENR